MQKHKISIEELKYSRDQVEQNLFSQIPSELKDDVKNAEVALDTFIHICEMVKLGCGITDIRKFINLYPERKKSSDQTEDGNDRDIENSPEDNESRHNQPSEDPVGTNPIKSDEPDEEKDKNKNRNHKGKRGAYDFENVQEDHCYVPGLIEKDPCPSPACTGRLYRHLRSDGRPRASIWFFGNAPITAKRYVFHDLRCNLCKKVYSASPPKELLDDGFDKEELYGYSAIATLVQLKYFSAMPWYRLSRLQESYDLEIPESSQWDKIEYFGNIAKFLFDYWKKDSVPKAKSFFGDDTSSSIRSSTSEVKKRRGTEIFTLRDGCHSSVIIAITEDDRHIVLIKTAIIHLGEWLDEVLSNRPDHLPSPQLMTDCSKNNKVTVIDVIPLACNQHARNAFKEQKKYFPKQCKEILGIYKQIFKNDRKTSSMSDKERLAYHLEHSKPLMDKIHDLVSIWKEDKISPENSEFGKALNYFLNHEKELRGFHNFEGATLSNNISERQMIKIALLRNVCKNFLNETGANVASVIFSVGLTAILSGVNILDYFIAILRFQDHVKTSPELFQPWNYQETVATLQEKVPPDQDELRLDYTLEPNVENTGPPQSV